VFLPAFVSSWFNHCQQSAAIIRVNSCAFVAKSNCKRSAAIFPFVFLHAFVSSWFNHCQQSAAISFSPFPLLRLALFNPNKL
jgi:hypothetical protein